MTSTTTQPTFDPQNVVHWINVLQNAARVPKTDADYANAQNVVQLAKQQIGDLNAAASAADVQASGPGKLATALVNFGEGASLGAASKAGDVWTIQNLVNQTLGKPLATTAGQGANSAYLSASRAAHPVTAGISDIAGAATLGGAASPLVAGLTPAQGAVVLGGGMGATRGAIDPIPGLTRGESAAIYGTVGAVSGYVVGKAISKLLPLVRGIATNVRSIFGETAPKNLAEISENAIRAKLRQLNVSPEMIERTIESWKTGTVSRTPIKPPIQMPVSARPGETVTPREPNLERATFFRRGGQVEQTTSPISGNRSIRATALPDVGKGNVLPYYPRGGQVEQAFGPPPQVSPSAPGAANAQAQLAAIAQYLRSLTPAQVPDAIAGAQALGIPLGGTPEQILAQLLGGH